MLSRVAESIYWMGRYIERAENVARFVDVNAHLEIDVPGSGGQWAPLVATTGDQAYFKERYGEATRESVLQFLTFDRDYASSIVSCLRLARENARSVREIISSEMWEEVNKAYLMVKDASLKDALDSPHFFFDEIKKASHLFVGVTYLTMTHNEAWHFLRLGRLLERADKTSRIVDVKYFILLPDVADVGTTFDEIQWAALLKSASAFEMYRKRFGRIVPNQVVEFLLLDRQFPRSMRYCLRKAERSLHAITGTPLGVSENEAERALGRLHAHLEYAHAKEIMKTGLHEWVDDFQLKLNEAGDFIYQTFFALHVAEAEEGDDGPTSRRW
jgi:uncharacterized alpha-E superfamily protein